MSPNKARERKKKQENVGHVKNTNKTPDINTNILAIIISTKYCTSIIKVRYYQTGSPKLHSATNYLLKTIPDFKTQKG